MGEMLNAYKILVRNPEMSRPLRRPKRRWEHNSRVDLREIWWEGADWMHLVQDMDQWCTVVKMVMIFHVP
jgi:hypothetical protein